MMRLRCYASLNGNLNIVELMFEKGANDYNEAMTSEARNGHLNIVELIQERMNSPSS